MRFERSASNTMIDLCKSFLSLSLSLSALAHSSTYFDNVELHSSARRQCGLTYSRDRTHTNIHTHTRPFSRQEIFVVTPRGRRESISLCTVSLSNPINCNFLRNFGETQSRSEANETFLVNYTFITIAIIIKYPPQRKCTKFTRVNENVHHRELTFSMCFDSACLNFASVF